ncbi:MAG: 7TM-DISM domain-containing protein, partial [Campylobacterota bacterium]|nr:7TM-DISM domain-containing protein [Campylobacterota bacterium]
MYDNNINILKKLAAILIFLTVIPIALFSTTSKTITVDKYTTKINISNQVYIYEDKHNNLTIQDLSSYKYKDKFIDAASSGNSFGFSKSTFWVRFSIDVKKEVSDSLYVELSYPLIDNVSLYSQNSDGTFSQKRSGEFILDTHKEVNNRNSLFRIDSHGSTTQTYYMKIKSEGSTQIPLNLLTSSELIEHVDTTNFILGGYYGNMFLLMIASFVVFYKIRDVIFLTYGIYLLSYLFFQLSMNGFFIQYF